MKKKKLSKKVLAIFLSFVLFATALPFGMMEVVAAAEPYDPAPKFSEAAITEGARAWLDDDGNVHVTYPAAQAEPTYKGEELSIAFYILELVDMGSKNSSHTNIVLDTIKVAGTSGIFPSADIGTIDLENKRYSVTVTAVDTENWFSLPLYATVVEVPAVTIDSSRFANLSSSPTAVREIMTFDQNVSGTNMVSGNALQYLGVVAETGTVDLTDYVSDTSALRFIMHTQPNGQQSFDTSTSRQTWDFSNATELWYWFDLTDVELTGVSFRLRANEKVWYDWGKDNSMTVTQSDYMGDIIYSTKGYTGTDGYVWVQRDDGGWDKVSLTNGTINLGDFKGYVRVPIQFICSENDSYAQLKNTGFNNGKTDFATGVTSATLTNGDNHANGIPITKTLVDAAGTNIKDARLMQHRIVATKTGIGGWGNANYWHFTNGQWVRNETEGITRGEDAMIAAGLSEAEVFNDADEGYKAIDDLYSAGFAFTGCSSDSISRSFYVDNIFFYDENGGPWDSNVVEGMPSSTGSPMKNYYDEETAIQRLIFDEIDKYIVTPGWEDFREINYILELIDAYRQIFEANGKSTAFLDLSKTDDGDGVGLAAAAEKLKRDSWANAWKAYEACVAEGTYGRANAGKSDLIPTMVRIVEKLPHPDNIATVSAALRDEIIKLWKGYTLLNLGQLEMLGKDEEEIILKYIALLEGNVSEDFDEFVVGTSLSNRPFILFDDFENYNLGTKSYQLEDAPDIYYDGETAYTDYRYTKNFVTYMPDTFEDFGGKSKDTDNSITAFLWGKQPTKNGFADNLIANVAKGEITDKGFQGSKGATVLVDGNFYKSGEGYYNVVSTTYRGAEAANIDALRATGTGNSNVLLGNMAKSFSSGEIDPYLSLVFYADFTQITDFNVSVTIQTYFDDSLNDFQIAMGTDAIDQNFFILDEESGEWIQANNAEDAGRMFAYTSRAGSDTDGDGVFDVTLAGYKGYVRIPLYHFKPGNNSQKLDESSLALNNIYRISIGVAPGSQDGANQMYGKSFTIDNIGFSYDPVQYSDKVATRTAAGIVDKNFDEFFGAKGLPAKQFEDFVDSIDLYSTSFVGDVSIARTQYNALTEYQKTVVTDAEALLREYELYANGTKEIVKATYTVSDITTLVNSLPDAIKSATTTGDNDIPYPGFSNGAVNYASMGIDRATADQIIEYYNNGYSRFSNEQKTSIMDQTVRTQFLNAYNMAMRMTTTLENIKVNAVGEDGRSGFLAKLTGLYTARYDYNDDGKLEDKDNSVADPDPYKIGNFVSIEEKQEVADFKAQNYDGLPYYSKTSIDDGSIYPQLTNTSRGFTYFLNNTRSFTVDGEEINGGILTLQNKMQRIYDMANDHITNKTLFTDAELQRVRDIVQEYNALLPAYYNVEELYELEQAIVKLFPVYQTNMGESTLMLSEENLSKSTEYTIEYSEYLDITDPYTDTFYVKVISQNGGMTNGYGDVVNYDVTIASNENNAHTVKAGDLAGLADTDWVATHPVTNNYSTPDGTQQKFTITAGVTSPQTGLHGMVTDVLTLQLCHPDGTVLEEQIVQVFYSMGDTYTVTIPANFPVEWGYEDGTKVPYTANTEMNEASSISVKVSSDGTGKMASVIDPNLKLDYTTANFDVETTFNGMVTNGTQDPAPEVTVSGWDDVPVGEYKTILTYTVVYDNGSDDGTT